MIPQNWEEISRKQLLRYCRAQQLAQNEAQIRLLAARYMLPLPWWLFYIVNRFQLAEITRELHWLLHEPLTLNLLPHISIRRLAVPWTKLYGPASHFANVRFAEFAVASAYYQAFMNNKNTDMLDYLLATLYRPLDGQADMDSPDRRVRFEQHHLSARVRLVRKMSTDKKMAVLLYFAGCMSELAMRYPLLFSGGEDRHQPSQHTGTSDWLDFMRHLPADKFGSLEQIENSLIHPVMEVANRMMADAKKEKARNRRIKKT